MTNLRNWLGGSEGGGDEEVDLAILGQNSEWLDGQHHRVQDERDLPVLVYWNHTMRCGIESKFYEVQNKKAALLERSLNRQQNEPMLCLREDEDERQVDVCHDGHASLRFCVADQKLGMLKCRPSWGS